MQRISTEKQEVSLKDDPHKSTQPFQLIQTALSDDVYQFNESKGKKYEHSIHRNIRPAVAGELEVVTEKLKEMLRGVNHGNRAKLAEAITLSEYHSLKLIIVGNTLSQFPSP